jgi:hypothetical protein
MVMHGAVVYDMNGREADEADLILGSLGDVGQYIFCSSAGVYLKSAQMPHFEVDAVDPKSRHKASYLLLPETLQRLFHKAAKRTELRAPKRHSLDT